jgi:hypothetical protein
MLPLLTVRKIGFAQNLHRRQIRCKFNVQLCPWFGRLHFILSLQPFGFATLFANRFERAKILTMFAQNLYVGKLVANLMTKFALGLHARIYQVCRQ